MEKFLNLSRVLLDNYIILTDLSLDPTTTEGAVSGRLCARTGVFSALSGYSLSSLSMIITLVNDPVV